MPVMTIDDHVKDLLSSPVAAEKVRGTPASDSEAVALFESIILNLTLYPRSVLYLAHLARNSLVKAIDDEVASIDEVTQLVKDFSNVSFAIKDTSQLTQALTSLLQVEDQGILTKDHALDRFSAAVGGFLDVLAKNVRGGGSQMLRPSSEAEKDLPSTYVLLKSQHNDVLDRLYALAVGVPNFFAANIVSVVGVSIVQKTRLDIQAMISDFENDDSAAGSRDVVTRLVAARAALRMLSSPPTWDAPITIAGVGQGGATLTSVNSDMIQPGDILGGIEILSVDGDTVTVDGVLAPFNGSVNVISGLVRMWNVLAVSLSDALSRWRAGDYAANLDRVDAALAGLTSSSPSLRTGEALRALSDLRAGLMDVRSSLLVPRPRSVRNEKRIVDGILTSLEERGYDRAVSLLLRCKVADAVRLSWQSASFAGHMMEAASDIARYDIKFPNSGLDEREVFSRREDP